MPLIAGMRLGPYEIAAPIGAGGMGEVYRARDLRLNRDVALKVLPHAFAQDPDRLRRFQLEAEAAGSLNHPNIVAVFDIGNSDGAVYVVTELLEGETIRQRLSASPLPPRKAVEYAVQVARGLAAAHAKGIAHRDIKPENLFLTRDGFVKILDFGLAKVASPSRGDQTSAPTAALETGAGVVLGTVGYMAPEQVRGAAIDQRCDLFSLGAVLYEMLAGKRAFGGESSVETMSAILKDEPADMPDTVSGALGGIVRRCLEKNPDERFGSARDLAFALESVSSASGREKPMQPPPAPRGRSAFARAAVAALLLALPLGAWLLAKRTIRAEPATFQQLTFRRGAISTARFANDGKSILYSAGWDGKPFELFSTQQDSPESRPLGLANAHIAAISRTGEMALILSPQAYMWAAPPSGTLARAPISGGAPREVAENVVSADWSADGSQLAIVRAVPGGQVLEYPPGHKLHESAGQIYSPKISPKGDMIAFQDCPLAWDGSGQITIVDTSGVKRVLSRRFWFVSGVGWSPDGSEVWFTGADRGNAASLQAVDRSGRERVVVPLPGLFALLDVASDGRVLLMHDSFVASLFFRRKGASSETDLYWHDNSVVRAISPDGGQILFSEGAGAATNDWVSFMRKTEGGAAVRLGEGFSSAISPDGKWAMLNPSGDRAPLIAFPTRAGSPQTLASDTIRHINGRWLPDGKRIIFVGSEPNHRLRFYVQDSSQSAARPISGENLAFDRGDDIVLSPDGASVAAAISEQGIQLLPIDGGAARSVPGTTAGLSPLEWCSDGSLLAVRGGEIPAHVLRIDLGSGRQQPWKDLAPVDRTALMMVGPIRVTPDCETYAYTAQYDPTTLWIAKPPR